ncbi:MAG: hypothetical protein ACYS3N_23195 [Planctomycetota bacterium]
MKRGTKAIIITVSSICLISTGCATVPTARQFAQASYGEYPIDYKEIVENYCDHRSFFGRSSSGPPLYPHYYSYWWLRGPYKGYFASLGQFEFGYIVHVKISLRSRRDWGASLGHRYSDRAIMIKHGEVASSMPLWQFKGNTDFLGLMNSYGKSVDN